MQLDEIRLNSHYATLGISEYKEGENEESTPIINKRIIRTQELLEKLNNHVKLQPIEYKVDHLFPPNCRYYEKHPEGHLVIIEEPPAYRTIAVDKDMSNEIESLRSIGKLEEYGYENWMEENPKKPYMFNLAMPYVIFVFGYSNTYDLLGGKFFLRTQPISGFNDPVCKAPLLNINESQSVCFGDRIYKGPKRSIFADVSHSIGTFWSTIFNPDYIYNYVAYQDVAGVCDYLTWEYYSHADPMFIYNVDWIKADRTIGEYIDEARGWVLRDSRRNNNSYRVDYLSLANLFDQQRIDEEVKVPGIDAREPLLYDVCQYLFLGDEVAYIGDSFSAKGQLHFIDSFLGFRKRIEPTYINIQREDGKLFRMMLTREVKKYLEEKIKELKYESSVELSNGLTLRPGDIMIMKNRHGHDVYRKVVYLRQSQDGEYIEGRFGSEFYIIDNLPEDIKILDMSKPEYKGIELIKDKEYFVLRGTSGSSGPIISVSFAKFNEVTTGRRSNLVAKLTESQGSNSGYNYTVNFSGGINDNQRIFEIDNVRDLPPVFRLGRRIMYARTGDRYHNEPAKAYVLPNTGVALPYGVSLRRAGSSMLAGQFIKDDTFKIESWDMDVEFKVGDKVVASDWQNPINMLMVKQIEGFVENKEDGSVSFALSDKNGSPTSYPYIDGRNGYVLIGSVRKITNKWEELSAGMKIISKEARISMFPKKDANIIIGFLYDTGGPEPLVLCSNACTLWYSDVIEKFDIIPMADRKWKGLEHAPINPSKMRIQAGDMLQGKSYFRSNGGYFAFRPTDSRTIRAQQMRYYGDYIEGYGFDRRFSRDIIFDAILNPRLTTTQENDLGFINALPNFHGMYTQTGGIRSGYMFPNDPRSILNVPNNSE